MSEFDRMFQPPSLPGGAPLCQCPGIAEVLQAELNGDERPLCPAHDVDAIKARDGEKQRAVLEDELALGYAAQERIRQDQAAERAEKTRAEHAAAEAEALAEMDPLVASLHLITGSRVTPEPVDPRHQIAIGDDAAFVRMLTEIVGGTANPTDPEGPTAA